MSDLRTWAWPVRLSTTGMNISWAGDPKGRSVTCSTTTAFPFWAFACLSGLTSVEAARHAREGTTEGPRTPTEEKEERPASEVLFPVQGSSAGRGDGDAQGEPRAISREQGRP